MEVAEAPVVTAPLRKRDAATSRAEILNTARRLFAADSYDQVGIRKIAAEAGFDPALVVRYFKSKELLFLEVVKTTLSSYYFEHLDRATFGQAVADMIDHPVDTDISRDHSWQYFQILFRAVSGPNVPDGIDDLIDDLVMRPLANWLGAPDGELRAKLIMTLSTGLTVQQLLSPPGRVLKGNEYLRFKAAYAGMIQQAVDGAV